MFNVSLTYEDKHGHPVSMSEMLSVFNIYYLRSPETFYLIPKKEYEKYRNPIFYIEEDVKSETSKVAVSRVLYNPSEDSEYNRIKKEVIENSKIVSIENLVENVKTVLSYHLREVNLTN